jgi:hypothetical protein
MEETFKVGDCVVITNHKKSYITESMIKMVGKPFIIQRIRHDSIVINNYCWSKKDLQKYHKPKEIKSEKFSMTNLVTKEFENG